MDIDRIEVVKGISDFAGSCVATLGTPTTAHELVLIEVFSAGVGNPPLSVTDDQGQTYTEIYGTDGITSHQHTSLWYRENSVAGVTTITVTLDTDILGGIIVGHYTGVATAGSLDQSGGDPTNGGTGPWASAPVDTTYADELIVGTVFAHYASGGGSVGISPSGGWTQQAEIQSGDSPNFDGNNGNSIAYADQIVSVLQTGVENTGTISAAVADSTWPGIATFKAQSDYAAEVLADNPVLFLEFEETSGATCADSSGNGLTATAQGSYTRDVGTLTGIGITTGASNSDCITIPDDSRLDITGSVTYELWVTTDFSGTDDGGYQTMMTKGVSGWNFRTNPSHQLEGLKDDITFYGGSKLTVPKDGDFHHCVMVSDSSTYIKFYIDGLLAGEFTGSISIAATSIPFTIARDNTGGSGTEHAPGTYDSVAVYASELTDARILAHYQAVRVPLTDTYENLVIGDGPISFWEMQESAEPLVDQMGNQNLDAHTGTITYQEAAGPLLSGTNTSIEVAGAGSYVNPSSSPMTVAGGGAFTIEGWVYLDSLSSGYDMNDYGEPFEFDATYQAIFGGTGAGAGGVHQLGFIHQGVNFFFDSSAATLTTGQWYYVILRRSAGSGIWEMLIDGQLYGAVSMGTAGFTLVGEIGNAPWNFADWAIYDYALLNSQVVDHYNNRDTTSSVTVTIINGTYTALSNVDGLGTNVPAHNFVNAVLLSAAQAETLLATPGVVLCLDLTPYADWRQMIHNALFYAARYSSGSAGGSQYTILNGTEDINYQLDGSNTINPATYMDDYDLTSSELVSALGTVGIFVSANLSGVAAALQYKLAAHLAGTFNS